MQALILAGGQATRLRPLTSRVPKMVVPLVGRPFISYMLEWLRSHGVDDVVISCGFLADGVRAVLGDGSQFGVRLRYVDEPEPLGTGGALKFAEEFLDERVFVLNGDVLTDIDLTAQLAQHEQTGARATLALVGVEDPSAYGVVHCRADTSVEEFLEKPGPEQALDSNLVNAGAYIIEREVLGGMAPAGSVSSIERDLFPTLVDAGLHGYCAGGYWLDIGTPERYLRASFDIMEGNVATSVGRRLAAASMRLADGAVIAGRLIGQAVLGDQCEIGAGAIVGGSVVLGQGVKVGAGARIERSVLLDGSSVGARTQISGAIIGAGAQIGTHCHISDGAMLGEAVRLGARNTLTAGVRIFPEVTLPEGAIRF
ncbi:MAG: sugar phosphate nucleotidyltransferase [Solirubrobacteraceae bacterium]